MRLTTSVHHIRIRQCLAALTLLLVAAGAWAQTGTLDKIKKSGTIVMGHREASIPFSYEPYALMMRKDDPAFRLAVNRELARLYRSEEIYDIYKRWLGVFGTPGPLLKDLYFLNGLPD